jgi:hypothetical protein
MEIDISDKDVKNCDLSSIFNRTDLLIQNAIKENQLKIDRYIKGCTGIKNVNLLTKVKLWLRGIKIEVHEKPSSFQLEHITEVFIYKRGVLTNRREFKFIITTKKNK